ncbi:hypothetical protein GGS26DRAFT_558412, partial [Hypomontagnella submonticulosa]
MESKTSRYQSRILREMHQNNENPFNSPPSSTGSHGTITLTSNLSIGPQAESTRRMDDLSIKLPSQATMRSAKAPQPTSLNINTSALGRTFPEWSRWNTNGPEHETDMWETASNAAPNPEGKENITPHGSPNSSVVATPRADESDRDKVSTHFLDYLKHLREKSRGLSIGSETAGRKVHIVDQIVNELDEGVRASRAARAARRELSYQNLSAVNRGSPGRSRPYVAPRDAQDSRPSAFSSVQGLTSSYLRSRRKVAIAAAEYADHVFS